MLSNLDSRIKVLEGLLHRAEDINAGNSLNYSTTRLSNTIVDLRKSGIKIKTVRKRTKRGRWYGEYYLVENKINRQKAKELLEKLKKVSK